MKTLEIVVTPEDIEQGQRHNAFGCPLALALGRQIDLLPGEEVIVGLSTASVGIFGSNVRRGFRLDTSAKAFVKQFDAGLLQPDQSYRLTLREEAL